MMSRPRRRRFALLGEYGALITSMYAWRFWHRLARNRPGELSQNGIGWFG